MASMSKVKCWYEIHYTFILQKYRSSFDFATNPLSFSQPRRTAPNYLMADALWHGSSAA
jgi:hypothetical protein